MISWRRIIIGVMFGSMLLSMFLLDAGPIHWSQFVLLP